MSFLMNMRDGVLFSKIERDIIIFVNLKECCYNLPFFFIIQMLQEVEI